MIGICDTSFGSTKMGMNFVELRVEQFALVKFLGDDGTFPLRTPSTARRLPAAKAAVICLGANNEDETGFLHLIKHPTGPAFGRRLVIRVEFGGNTLGAEPVGDL
jgi:hypothetical protein